MRDLIRVRAAAAEIARFHRRQQVIILFYNNARSPDPEAWTKRYALSPGI